MHHQPIFAAVKALRCLLLVVTLDQAQTGNGTQDLAVELP
jgi:hypothetical protein